MPPRWIHDTMDIIWCCRSYWRIHKEKDKHSKFLGKRHRIIDHEFYWKFENAGDFLDNISKLDIKSEEEGVRIVHDLLDKIWNESSLEERKLIVRFFYTWILDVDLLWEKAGVNPKKGLVKIYYPEQNKEIIEYDPQLQKDWLNLTKFIKDKTIEELL